MPPIKILIRSMHYYASMMTCFLIAFYALSGFIATHADWFLEGHSHSTHEDIRVRSTEDPQTFCRNLIAPDASVQALANDLGEQWYLVQSPHDTHSPHSKRKAIRCVVNESDVEVFQLHYFPAPTDTPPTSANNNSDNSTAYDDPNTQPHYQALQKITGGEISNHYSSIDDNGQPYNIHTCDIDSVWFHAQAMIFTTHGVYEINAEAAPLIQSITDLHKGAHSAWWQTLIADATAILLLFVVISGSIIGIQMKKKRTLGTCALGFSLLLTIALLCAR